ncbi:MAG: hypothetical protein EON60_11780 [Alphaproteobacteria bacterium]|nr:MAG: hypothetical protein EON60_11780 [Alphaproteobacteria bacterium]
MRLPLLVMMTVMAAPVMAQTLNDVGVDSVRSGIGEEGLAPLPMRAQPSTTLPAATEVSPVAVVNPLEVKGVVVTLSDTTGFDRDAALEVAAKQGLPQVLETLGHSKESATGKTKSLGNAMRFVQGYKVVKESLIPTYTLTADLTFNGPMVMKNFGGKMPAAAAAGAVAAAATPAAAEAAVAEAVEVSPVKQWVVKIRDRDPAAVDKVRVNLSKQPGTRATYRLLTSEGAELLVDTTMDASDVQRVAGRSVEVIQLFADAATTATPAAGQPWQGQAPDAASGGTY